MLWKYLPEGEIGSSSNKMHKKSGNPMDYFFFLLLIKKTREHKRYWMEKISSGKT